jgi:aminopeptidase C
MTESALARSFKQALTETLRENREVLRDLLAEVIEDVSIVNAIREGEKSKPVKRASVMTALRNGK